MKGILVTGTAGFIGSKVSEMLLEDGYDVIGVDISMIITLRGLNFGALII